MSALFVAPVGMAVIECVIKDNLWHYGNTWIWMLALEIIFAAIVWAIHQKAEDRCGDHRYFFYEIWAVYLIVTDLLVLNLQSSVAAQILLWGHRWGLLFPIFPAAEAPSPA